MLLFLLCLFLFSGGLWLKTRNSLIENGPELISTRMALLFDTHVTLTDATLSFPNHLLLKNVRLFDVSKGVPLLQSPRLEIDLSLLSMLSGSIRPKNIRFIAPVISSSSNDNISWPKFLQNFLLHNADPLSGIKTSLMHRIKPVNWPVRMTPTRIELLGGQAHIENEQDSFPTIDGSFDLTVMRSPDPVNIAVRSATLHINDVTLFYHGIQGKVGGVLQADASNATAQLTFTPPGSEEVTFDAKVEGYKNSATVTFALDAKSYDLKNLALIKYPVVQMSPAANVTGFFTSSSPVLYGKPFDSFSASIIFNQGAWRIDAISLRLKDKKGELTGSIIPDQGKDSLSVKANLFYTGTNIPDFKFADELLNTLGPIILQGPYSVNMEMAIDINPYPIMASEIKLTSNSHGDLFAKGAVDLFSGYADMTGSYLQPTSLNKITKDAGLKSAGALTLGISGPLTSPYLSEPPTAHK
jgi:hypothetical protein